MREMRLSRFQMFMDIAQTVAKRSTCMRNNVGVVVCRDHRIVSIGYNGPPSGHPHCQGNQCDGALTGCSRSIHAEANALLYAPQGAGMDMYVTLSPCADCFRMIVEDGRVDRLFFLNPYRIIEHLDDSRGIEVYRMVPAGYMIKWETKQLVRFEK